jgi:hypothetical protein
VSLEPLFSLLCCGRLRGVLWVGPYPYPILVCSRCDYDHAHATIIPNEHKIRDQNQEPRI